jgi:hypothetical protein
LRPELGIESKSKSFEAVFFIRIIIIEEWDRNLFGQKARVLDKSAIKIKRGLKYIYIKE